MLEKVKKFRFYHYKVTDPSLEHPIGIIITPKTCHVFHTPGTPSSWLKDIIVRNPYHAPGELILCLRWFYILRTGLPADAPVRYHRIPVGKILPTGEYIHLIETYFPPIQEVGKNWDYYNRNNPKTWPINQ